MQLTTLHPVPYPTYRGKVVKRITNPVPAGVSNIGYSNLGLPPQRMVLNRSVKTTPQGSH